MNNGDQDFDDLRKLLKLKRYEQPPPGYFDHLSSRVMTRLERHEAAGRVGFLDRLPWLVQLRRVLGENPISSGIFAVCGVLMVTLANTEYLDKYVANGDGASVAVAAIPTASSEQLADNRNFASGLKVADESPLPAAAIPGIFPSVTLGAMDSSMNSFSVGAQPVNFISAH